MKTVNWWNFFFILENDDETLHTDEELKQIVESCHTNASSSTLVNENTILNSHINGTNSKAVGEASRVKTDNGDLHDHQKASLKDKEERMRMVREKRDKELADRKREIEENLRRKQEQHDKQIKMRQKKIDEQKMKEMEKRAAVEERRKRREEQKRVRLNEFIKREQDRELQRQQQVKVANKLGKSSEWDNHPDQMTASTNSTSNSNTINKSQSAYNLNSNNLKKYGKINTKSSEILSFQSTLV